MSSSQVCEEQQDRDKRSAETSWTEFRQTLFFFHFLTFFKKQERRIFVTARLSSRSLAAVYRLLPRNQQSGTST